MLCEMLNCGYLDLEMLDKCGYDYEDIKHYFDNYTIREIDLGIIMKSCLEHYIYNISEKLENIITETETELKELERYSDENNGNIDNETIYKIEYLRQELEDLQELNVNEDIEYYFNYLDTSMYIANEEIREIYNKYLSEEIEEENKQIGFVELDLE